MAKYPNKISTPTAITNRCTLDLSGQHITTGNFMDFMVAKRMRLVPHQSVEVNHNVFSRLDPMEVPTYGDSDIRVRAFFVPYRTVFPAWDDFIEDAVHTFSDGTSSLLSYAPRIKNSQLVLMFQQTSALGQFPALSTLATNIDSADIVIIQSNGTPQGYNLTPHGSRCLKILLSLGYGIDFNLKNAEIYHSAMPLLCLAKVYYDWYYQNQYISDEYAQQLEYFFNYDLNVDFAEFFNKEQLTLLFGLIDKVNYDSDYFVSAWDNPVAPTNNSFSAVQIDDITVQGVQNKIVQASNNGTPYIYSPDVTSSPERNLLSQYSMDALKSLNDYVKRKQIAGARVFDRYLAEFGVTLQSEALKRSIYIADYIQPVNVGDVTSTSDTINLETGEGAPLGSYAGKGISSGNGFSFNFETVEYGEVIIINTILPRTGYYQGQDKTTMMQTRTDFWLPEFDSLGVQSLDTREVFMPLDAREQYPTGTTTYNQLNYNNYVFGFVPRYAELKRGVDLFTGDYRLRSREVNGKAWCNFRDVLPSFANSGIAGTKHDRIFTTGADSEQYNRFFYVTSDEYDHFKLQHTFNITSSFAGHALYDDYEFKDEDKAKKVSIDLQGVKAN